MFLSQSANNYPKDSFERFGDDLCESILSYLRLTDKFKYECVCSQWQRLVFSRQHTIHINDFNNFYSLKCLTNNELETKYYNIFSINETNFECLLKKCQNIKSIKIDWKCICDGLSLQLIADNCPHLERLTILSTEHLSYSEKVLHYFGSKCGQNLKSFETDDKFNGNFKILLNYCSNLRSIRALKDSQILINCDHNFLPKLRDFNYLFTEDKDIEGFELLTDKYWNQIQKLDITIKIGDNTTKNQLISSDLNQLFKQISRFSKLESLKINLKSYFGKSFAAGIGLIGQKCPKLVYFDFETYDTIILDNIFNIFENFKHLKYLSIHCRYLYKYDSVVSVNQTVNYGSVKCLSKCRHLTHLMLNLLYLNDKNLENIDSILPKLKLIELKSCKSLTNKTIESIARLEYLQKLRIFCGKNIENKSICNLIEKRPLLRDLYFDGSPNITKNCLNILWINAIKYPKINYKFYYSGTPVMEISFVPNNLKISNFWDKQWY